MIVRFVKTEETFADLHRRLGEVPLDRIRLKPAPGTATEEDLLRARKPICELIDGVLVEKAMGDRESMLGLYVGSLLLQHVQASDIGVVLGADGYIRVTSGQVRAPDVTFIPFYTRRERYHVSIDANYPNLKRWAEKLVVRPQVAATL